MEKTTQKIKNVGELAMIADKLRKNKKTIVTTNGCFDLLHIGHIYSLEQAKSLGDILIVGINTDKSIKKLKGKKRPITPEDQRIKTVATLHMTDYVFLFEDDTPSRWLEIIRPHIHAKGADRKLEEIPEKRVVEKYGGKIELIPLLSEISTTHIVKKIKKHH